MDLQHLPEHVRAYKRTPEFTEATVPAGLRRSHETKAGVWGRICVLEGQLLLRFAGDGRTIMLSPERAGVVRPNEVHEVEPVGAVRFYLEFHAEPQGHEPATTLAPQDAHDPVSTG